MKMTEQRCGETKDVEEQLLTEERMTKCAHKKAPMLTGSHAVRYFHISTRVDIGDGTADGKRDRKRDFL